MSKPVLLPLSQLQEHEACCLDQRIEDFTSHHGFVPDETSTLRQWAEVTPDTADLLWATRCLHLEHVRPLVIGTALRAARRVLPIFEAKYPEDKRPREALDRVERRLACPASEWETEPRNAARATRAADAATYAADAAIYTAYASSADAAADAAACAAYAAYAAYAVDVAERAQQRADFLEILTELEAGT